MHDRIGQHPYKPSTGGKEGCAMPFIILDPRSGTRVVITSAKSRAEQKARQWVFRELDRLAVPSRHESKMDRIPDRRS
jgi:hypothetical protein